MFVVKLINGFSCTLTQTHTHTLYAIGRLDYYYWANKKKERNNSKKFSIFTTPYTQNWNWVHFIPIRMHIIRRHKFYFQFSRIFFSLPPLIVAGYLWTFFRKTQITTDAKRHHGILLFICWKLDILKAKSVRKMRKFVVLANVALKMVDSADSHMWPNKKIDFWSWFMVFVNGVFGLLVLVGQKKFSNKVAKVSK